MPFGDYYPESANMPYLILAQKDYISFGGMGSTLDTVPDTLLMTNISLDIGGERPVAAQICGVLEDESSLQDESAFGEVAPGTAYMGLSTAMAILGESGLPSAYTSLDVWAQSAYEADSIIKEIPPIGFMEGGSMTLMLDTWRANEGEANFLLVASLLLMLYSLLLVRYVLLYFARTNRHEFYLLHDLGLPKKRIGRMLRLMAAFAGLIAGITALIAYVCIPFYYSGDLTGFHLCAIRALVFACAGGCIGIGVVLYYSNQK